MGLMPVYARLPVTFSYGKGAYLYTDQGDRYLDFAAGVAVNALGHAHPVLIEALSEQAKRLWHTSNLYHVEQQIELAKKLTEASFADVAFFCNSGAEAVEAAIKTARRYHHATGQGKRYRLITFEGAFHGRTLAAIAAGGQPKHLQGFGPPVEGFDHAVLNDLDTVQAVLGPQTAGIMIEPIQGEGGVRVAEPDFLRVLRALCDRHGILLIFDEVQTGVGRTGSFFAYQESGVAPDILATAKGLGGGFPIGACLATKTAAQGMTAGSHGSTFGGNPLACAVANAVVDIVNQPAFLNQVKTMGAKLRHELEQLCQHYPDIFQTVRGRGLLLGLQCRIANTEVVTACAQEKLLCVAAGDNVLRLLPPLTITEVEIDEALTAIRQACDRLQDQQASAQPAKG